jgi:hypothetical protein
MDFEELKRKREENLKAHKRKKRAYYLKSKVAKDTTQSNKNSSPRPSIDYAKELSSGLFSEKIKEIARKQKLHIDDRKETIIKKIQAYREQKKEYYQENREKRLEYDKQYREEKKEKLKEYRQKYYEKNREKILEKQRESRRKKSQKQE